MSGDDVEVEWHPGQPNPSPHPNKGARAGDAINLGLTVFEK
jgi:hypothetical protein